MRQLLSHIVSLVLLAWVLLACNYRPEHTQTIDQLPAIYPDYIGVTIPVGIAPLNFSMADDDFTDIDVEIILLPTLILMIGISCWKRTRAVS